MNLKPIETRFDGYLFRSRLEARWAVFLKTLGVPYEYEKEGYDLGASGWYLPDFWLPVQKCWVEIKGKEPTEKEEASAHYLAALSGHPVYVFFGPIPLPEDKYGNGLGESAAVYYGDTGDDHQHWCICKLCRRIGIEFDGRSERLPCGCYGEDANKEYTAGHPRLIAAYTAARSARFEHGARG